MRRLALILCFLATPALAAVTIDAPSGPVPVGRFVVLPISGAEAEPQVLLAPKGADALIDISVGQPTLVFRAAEPGSYEVVVVASRERVIPDDCYARCLILVGEQPEPKPKPDPPPPPVDTLSVQCVWEKSQALPVEQYLLLNSTAVADWCDLNGHRLRRLDVDAVDDGGELVVEPRPESLPVVRVLNAETGAILWEGMPADEAEFLATLQRYCKSCQPSKTEQPSAGTSGSGSATSSLPAEAAPCPTCPPEPKPQPRSQPSYRRRGLLRR